MAGYIVVKGNQVLGAGSTPQHAQQLRRFDMKCKDCKWWELYRKLSDTSIGACRRALPVISAQSVSYPTGVWPETRSSDWCGYYEPQPAPDADSLTSQGRC